MGDSAMGAASGRTLRSAETAMVQGLLAMAGASVLTGAMMRAMAMAIEWAGTRVQFGRPIGQFQAIQHSLALAAEELAASRAALDWAAQELEVGRPMPAAAIAKARAAEAAGKVAAITHQVHGAIGFTAEFSLFRSTQQLWLWRDRWGDEHHWNAWLGRQALAAGPDGLDALRWLVAHAANHLNPGGWLLLEHGHDQADAVQTLLRTQGWQQVQSRLDEAGIRRCTGAGTPGVK
jgi:hypothetical protein